jgi:NADH dehydrogenase
MKALVIHASEGAMNVAVAGGTGFVGGGIAAVLDRRGHRVFVLTRRRAADLPRLPADWDVRETDGAGPEGLAPALAGVEVLVIAIAFHGYPMENPRRDETFEAVDAAGTERLVGAAVEAGVRHVVYISGAGAAPDAPEHWFRAKWRAEEAVRRSGLRYTILRPTWLFGPRDAALNRFLGFSRFLPFVPLTGSGRQLLAPVFIDDLGEIVADALTAPAAADRVFEVGGPETMTMNDVVRTALRVAGRRRFLLHAPEALMRLAAWPLQFLPRPPLTPDAITFVDQPATVDVGPLLAAMPRRLTTLEEGLRTYLGRKGT